MALDGTAGVGPETTYSSNMVEVRQLEDALTLISPDEQPLLDIVGLGNRAVMNWKFEWQEDELFPTVLYADGGGGQVLADETSGTQSSMTVQADTSGGSAAGFVQPGDLLLIGDEVLWVLSVDGEDLVVIRGYGQDDATTAAIADNARIDIIGRALQEGSSPGYTRYIAPTQPYGVTQIWDENVEITGSETQIENYGVSGPELLNYRLEKRMRELKEKMEKSLLYGERYSQTDAGFSDNSQARTSGGIKFYLDAEGSVTDLSAAALTEDDIVDTLQTIWEDAGSQFVPDMMVGNIWPKRKMNQWYRGLVQTDRAERVGGVVIDMIETEFGMIDYLLDRNVLSDHLFLLRTEDIDSVVLGNRTLKEFDATVPGKDHVARRILGEYGWELRNPQTMHLIENFSTTA